MNSWRQTASPRLLGQDGVNALVERIKGLVSGGGVTDIRLEAWWRGEIRWARNRVSLASDRRDVMLTIWRWIDGRRFAMGTNQLDRAYLGRFIPLIEEKMKTSNVGGGSRPTMALPTPTLPYPNTAIWSDATYNLTAEQRGEVARLLTVESENQGMLSAGYIEMRATEFVLARFGEDTLMEPYPSTDTTGRALRRLQDTTAEGNTPYQQHTEAQCSMTVRHPKGLGSGWAGLSSYDWTAIDAPRLASTALDKCLHSLNPVAVEPGRYTMILEPQATASFLDIFCASLSRPLAESGGGPWSLGFDRAIGVGRSKLGLQVVDPRVTIRHDPMDPQLGILPAEGLTPAVWIEKGILKNLYYRRDYALRTLNDNLGELDRPSFRMEGGPTTPAQMIETTERGILVTRFTDIRSLPGDLYTGLTRDGLWLIEAGKITKAIKNMRFTDSPFFVLNQLEQIGPAVPVFNPQVDLLAPIIVPTIKSRDFAFTSMVDAI